MGSRNSKGFQRNSADSPRPPSGKPATGDTEPVNSDDSASQIMEAASIQICGATGRMLEHKFFFVVCNL